MTAAVSYREGISIKDAAEQLGTGPRKLLKKLRELRWVNGENQPMWEIRQRGWMTQFRGSYRHPVYGNWVPSPKYTPLLTKAGITELKDILERDS